MDSNRPVRYFALTLLALAVVASFARLFVGLDFYDESYWLSFHWRFALGDRPYWDEKSFHQNFSLFLFPFVWVFERVRHSSEGLVLYMRLLFFFFTLAFGAAAFRTFRKLTDFSTATFLTTLALLVPVTIPNFSYGSLGFHGATLGAFALILYSLQPQTRLAVLAGIAHAVGTASDPTWIPACAAMGAATCCFCEKRRELVVGYLGPLLAIGAGMLAYAGPSGVRAIWESKEYLGHSTFSVNFPKHLRDFLAVPYRPLYLTFAAAAAIAWRKCSAGALAALTWLIAPLCLLIVLSMGYGVRFLFAYFGMVGIVLYALLPKNDVNRRLFWIFWVPSLLAGVCLSWSGNIGGVARLGNGMFLSVAATTMFAVHHLRTLRLDSVKGFTPAALTAILVLGLTLLDWHRHFPLRQDTLVARGPFRGLWTEKQKAEWQDSIYTELRKRESIDARVLFHPHFPAGYLFTRMRPAASNVWWTFPYTTRIADFYLEELRRYETSPTIAVLLKRLYYDGRAIQEVSYPVPRDRIGPHVLSAYRLELRAPTFEIYAARR